MRKMILLLLCVISAFVTVQSENLDSLINVLNTNKFSPTGELELLKKICLQIPTYDATTRNYYAGRASVLAEKENDKITTSWFYNNIAGGYDALADYDSSMFYFRKALDLARVMKNEEREIAYVMNIGNSYTRQGKYTAAIKYYMDVLPLCEMNSHDEKTVRYRADILCNIAELYLELKNIDRALYYLEQAEALVPPYFQTHYIRGRIYFERGEFEESLRHELEAMDMLGEAYPTYKCYCAQFASACYIELGNYDEALEYARKCLLFADIVGDPKLYVKSYNALSNVYRAQKLWVECETTALEAWDIDPEDVDNGPNIVENVILANINLGNKNKAGAFLTESKRINKRYNNRLFHETLIDMEVKYETEKKEFRIAVLEKDKKLYVGFGLLILLILFLTIGLLFSRYRINSQKRKLAEQQIKQLEQEKELIAARLVLDAEKAEREIIARDLHDGIGAMLSVVKNNLNLMNPNFLIENGDVDYFSRAMDGLDKSIVELRRVAHHIMPAVLIEKGLLTALDDFCRSIPEAEFYFSTPDQRFDPEKELVLYRCAYELINNAMRHSGASRIKVHLNVGEEMAFLSVVDNGKGFDPQTTPEGMGLSNLRERLSVFNGQIDIYSEPGKGTEVNVELKKTKGF